MFQVSEKAGEKIHEFLKTLEEVHPIRLTLTEGGIVLRTSVRSAHREAIAALVLDSPAVDWQDILIYHATALKAPRPMRRLALWMMTSNRGARIVRLEPAIVFR